MKRFRVCLVALALAGCGRTVTAPPCNGERTDSYGVNALGDSVIVATVIACGEW